MIPHAADAGLSKIPELRDAKIFTAIGDGAAGNLGCGADRGGCVAINIGTSAAVRVVESSKGNAAKPTPFGLFRYAIDRERTVLGGAVSNAGNLRRWNLRELRLEGTETKALSRRAAATDPLTVLPFWVGERAPTWPDHLGGSLVGLTQASDAAEILRATSCAVFYRLGGILDLIEKTIGPAKEIIVSGGVLHSGASLRLLADALGRDLCVSTQAEASLRGAAIYALETLGHEATALRKAKVVRHDRELAKRHRFRREKQVTLEKLLSPSSV